MDLRDELVEVLKQFQTKHNLQFNDFLDLLYRVVYFIKNSK
jgi:hypothetical protein